MPTMNPVAAVAVTNDATTTVVIVPQHAVPLDDLAERVASLANRYLTVCAIMGYPASLADFALYLITVSANEDPFMEPV